MNCDFEKMKEGEYARYSSVDQALHLPYLADGVSGLSFMARKEQQITVLYDQYVRGDNGYCVLTTKINYCSAQNFSGLNVALSNGIIYKISFDTLFTLN